MKEIEEIMKIVTSGKLQVESENNSLNVQEVKNSETGVQNYNK